jgi:NADH-quinone oxidoreductase subunit M
MLFFLAGSIKDRYHTREIAEIGGGMFQVMPRMGGIFAFVAIASLGLPGLAGFWGEIMALLAAFSPAESLSNYVGLYRVLMVFGALGTVLTAGYFLWMMQRVMMGQAPDRWKQASLHDVSTLELGTWLPLLLMTAVLGVLPVLVTGMTDTDVIRIMQVFS